MINICTSLDLLKDVEPIMNKYIFYVLWVLSKFCDLNNAQMHFTTGTALLNPPRVPTRYIIL